MPPASPQYTLVGFSPELDFRPLTFLKPLPPHRVCSACGLVRKRTALLPCMHTLCECCYEQCTHDGLHVCPLDGNGYEMEDVNLMDVSADELLRREVKCWNASSGCQHATAASRLAQHFQLECEHHSVRCPRCSAAVLCQDVCAHLTSASCIAPTPLASESEVPPGHTNETASLTSVKGAFERQAGAISAYRRPMAADIGPHGERFIESSHGINAPKETVRQELAVSSGQKPESLREPVLDMIASNERLEDIFAACNDRSCSFSASVSNLHETRTNGLSKTRDELSRTADPMKQTKPEVNEKNQKGLEHVSNVLRRMEVQVAQCVFYVKGVISIRDTATEQGWAAYDSEKVYLRGYCMSPGVFLIKGDDSATLHARYTLHKGDMDDFIQWPFQHKMRASVIHPKRRAELVVECKPCPRQERHQKPSESSNLPGYIPGSFNLNDLLSYGYVENDRLRIKWELLP